jgi:hypothetical protein
MEKQQTTVDWLIEQMKQRESQGLTLSMYELEMFAEQANKMFEEQIIEAWVDGVINWDSEKESQQYYNETFKTEE